MKKKTIIFALSILCLVGIASGIEQYFQNNKSILENRRVDSPTYGTEESRMIDYSDEKILLGDSHNVFVGKVLRETSRKSEQKNNRLLTSIQFAAEVIFNVKGNLRGTVTISQLESQHRPRLLFGSSYIFAARYSSDENVYIATIYPWTYQLLTEDMSLSSLQLRTMAENNEKIKALQAAYPNEQVPLYDIKANKAYNSYASRRYDANGELIDDTVELRKQLEAANAAIAPAPSESVSPSPTPEASPSEEGTPRTGF